jgi:hypothetical protein
VTHIEECHPEEAKRNVRYLGFREVPESEQVWEIHLQPRRSCRAVDRSVPVTSIAIPGPTFTNGRYVWRSSALGQSDAASIAMNGNRVARGR